jgi:hypothetical protein
VAQNNDFILNNKTLNNELLEVEELLIEAGLLTPSDIMNPSHLTENKLKIEAVA